MEDNQATILIAKKGFSTKLRHIQRTHKVNLGCLAEQFGEDTNINIYYIDTNEQASDISTKGLERQKWGNALNLLGVRIDLPM